MEGNYQLTGIRETASGLTFYPDGRFDFFYSYGAIDRHGYGKWEKINDIVFLTSEYADKKGFDIVEQSGSAADPIVIALEKPDAYFASLMRAAVINGQDAVEAIADKSGTMQFAIAEAEKIMVMNDLFPDNIVTLDIAKGKNKIVIRPNHDIMLVHFNKVRCISLPDELICPIPLLNMMYGERTFIFRKGE